MLGLSKMRAAPGDYASSPTLYRWDVEIQRFTVHQELAQTAVASMALIREGGEAHLVLAPITQGAAECGDVPPVAEVHLATPNPKPEPRNPNIRNPKHETLNTESHALDLKSLILTPEPEPRNPKARDPKP